MDVSFSGLLSSGDHDLSLRYLCVLFSCCSFKACLVAATMCFMPYNTLDCSGLGAERYVLCLVCIIGN